MRRSACALVACAALGGPARAQDSSTDKKEGADNSQTVVVTGKRAQRVSKGATGLPLDVKDTPQSISSIDGRTITDFGLVDVNDALRLATGLNVDQYETNRATFNARGFEIQLTQIDGLGVSNDWGTVVGQQDTYLFERIELIRGANGLLTGVGNASGTINYVRKRPLNRDGGEAGISFGSWNQRRITLDYNKLLTVGGDWAARVVLAHDDKDSYLRALHDMRSSLYAVVDGQIGRDGVLTLGLAHTEAKQRSPMWGSLTLKYADGSRADFDVSSSTSQDWTYWNTRWSNAFAEYAHRLASDWEAKLTLTRRSGDGATQLLYAYVAGFGPGLNPDNSGLVGWPYRSRGTSSSTVLDAHLNGRFDTFGRRHEAILGLSQSRQKHDGDYYPVDPALIGQPLPAFAYAGNVFAEPAWGVPADASAGSQRLTRLYGAARLALTPELKAIAGLNAIKLQRKGQSRFGSQGPVTDPDTSEASPYVGFTYDITPTLLAYASYSDIFLSQDQTDIDGVILAPMRGVNAQAGLKAEWLSRQLLTTIALFSAQQDGLATYAGVTPGGQFY
jgi:outer membrane receptor for ferric coprogen and ferric-rhodotorulic acid